jgi:indole-3-glycerol phosphate synthase
VLGRIVGEAAERAAAIRARPGAVEELERAAANAAAVPSLSDALGGEHVAIIAEVKRRSPSKGEINAALTAAAQATSYARGGAAAISVLTEPAHFGGSLADLREARIAGIPLLRKDFHVDELQLLEARAAGASAALLIVRALSPEALPRLAAFARGIGLEVLVETRSEGELDRALAAGAEIVGVNNRDLETLEIDQAVGDRLLRLIPRSCRAVAESGVRSVSDVRRAAEAGADAVLVGSSLSGASDPTAAVAALGRVARNARAR